jgi:hypothetical protein
MTPVKLNFKVYQGSTFNEVLRWESSKKVYKPITNITQSAPCVVTAPTNGLTAGWRFRITNVGGMVEINSPDTYHSTLKLDSNNLELNNVNSVGYKAYTSGGILEYSEPVDLTGFTARMQVREKIDSDNVLEELTTENGGIIVDAIDSGIILTISAEKTSTYTFSSAVYGLELVSPSGIVFQLATGSLTLIKEVTR